jgi:hypothetical protein
MELPRFFHLIGTDNVNLPVSYTDTLSELLRQRISRPPERQQKTLLPKGVKGTFAVSH